MKDTTVAIESVQVSPARARFRPLSLRFTAIVWLAIPMLLLVACLIILPWSGLLQDPNRQSLSDNLEPPVFAGGSWAHPLGTDRLGHDLLSALVYGGRLTLLIGLLGALAAVIPGAAVGLIAGYRGGKTDVALSRVIDAQLALPFILVALAIISSRGHSVPVLLLVLGITGWAPCARIVRSSTMALRSRPFVLALRAAGASEFRIIARHIVPNLVTTIVAVWSIILGTAILVESALSFLGLGVVPPNVSWGSTLASGRDQLTDAWWIAAAPGVAITIVVLLVNLIGDALLTHFDPRKSGP